MCRNIRSTTALLLVCAAFLTACSHVNHLREAQDSFNRAAETDNLYRFGSADGPDLNTGKSATDALSATAGYAATIAVIEELKQDREASSKLQDDGLYGYALVLQSLAYWRLGKWEESVAVSREAQDSGDLGPRDLALMQALPGLIKNNQAHARLKAEKNTMACAVSESDGASKWDVELGGGTVLNLHCSPGVIEVRDQLGGALCNVEDARTKSPPGHSVRDYLALTQLATIANTRDLCDSARYSGAPAKFSSACVDETIRLGGCLAGDPYQDDPDALINAIVNDFCRGRVLEQKTLVWDLVNKSGIDSSQILEACPEPAQ